MDIRHKKRRVAAVATASAVMLVLAASGVALATFLTTGTGTGAVDTANPANLTVEQVGPAYDSLIPAATLSATTDPYHQDQTFGGAGVTEFGNEVTLATAGRLANVVVGFRSWGAAVAKVPVTVTLYQAPAAPVAATTAPGAPITYGTVTTTVSVPAGSTAAPVPFLATFDFSTLDLTLPAGPIVYGISFTSSKAPSLNVLLSSSASDVSVGSDPATGFVFVNVKTGWLGGWQVDAGKCSDPSPGSFVAADVHCTSATLTRRNYGAYGSKYGDDIPAVELNVMGGAPSLYPGTPGQPIEYAIENPGSPVSLTSMSAAVTKTGTTVTTPSGTPMTGCRASWYQVHDATFSPAKTVPSGTSFYDAAQSGLSIGMITVPARQTACKGVKVGLTFTAN